MAGLNLVTGTGRQTVEELKRAVIGLDPSTIAGLVNDVGTLQTEMTTAQGDIENLDSRVQVLETSGTSEDTLKVVNKVSTTLTNISFGPSDTNSIYSEILSPIYTLSSPTNAVLKAGSSTAVKYRNKNDVAQSSFKPLYVIIPQGTSQFRIHYKHTNKGVEVTTYVLENSTDVVKEAKWFNALYKSGLDNDTDAVNNANAGYNYIKGNFPVTINLSTVTENGTTVTVETSYAGYHN